MPVDLNVYTHLTELFPDETVTHARTEDVQLPDGAGVMALIRLDNDHPRRPNTLGPASLLSFAEAVTALAPRAEAGEIDAVGLIGTGGVLAAGADLMGARQLTDANAARQLAELGHDAYNELADLGVPTFAFINGTALGGGLEIALAADYRTVAAGAKGIGLPEAFLGLVPGWGGLFRLPRLIGPERAAKIIFDNALNSNRTLKATQVYDLGIADAICADDSFEQESLAYAAKVMTAGADTSALTPTRAHDDSAQAWEASIAAAERTIAAKTGQTAPAPLRALEIFSQVPHRSREEDRREEVAALGDLLVSHEFSNVVYAFMDLTQKRAKSPAGVPEASPRPITKIGVVGAGLMASQLALVFAQQLQVPVVLTDLDQQRVDQALGYIRKQAEKLQSRGRLNAEQAQGLISLVTGSTDKSVYADADFIIEAVFEEISVKKQVFSELEEIISPEAVLATNTSSLSVTEMASDLKHPERVIGFHFFNPVAVMPLVEIARTPETTDQAIATAFAVAAGLRKSPVLTKDTTAFVVNRVLLRLMAEVQRTVDEGSDLYTADQALHPLGLPMTPFELLTMVGLPVAQHVTESLRASFGDRFHVSENVQRLIDAGVTQIWTTDDAGAQQINPQVTELFETGEKTLSAEEILHRVENALAEEIGLLLEDEVVASPKDVDLCMILGAGWPFHRGGITPYLDQQGITERALGRRFHS